MLHKLLQNLPLFKGKQRLARLLFKKQIKKGTPLTITGKYKCVYNIPNLQENIGFEILINGIYERHTIEFLVSKVRQHRVVLDLGANIGAIAVPVSKLRPDIQIVCLEASPWVFNYLARNTTQNNCKNVSLINKAISDQNSVFIDFYSPKDNYGKGSLAAVFTSEAVKIETITLEQIVAGFAENAVDFIKIDVEGFESLAFRGGEQFLRKPDSPDILFEFVDWAEDQVPASKVGGAQALLFEYGYRIYPFKNGKLNAEIHEPMTSGASLLFATKRMSNL
jgi:FkbM family methyltransferase